MYNMEDQLRVEVERLRGENERLLADSRRWRADLKHREEKDSIEQESNDG